jgi:hypothetical protein
MIGAGFVECERDALVRCHESTRPAVAPHGARLLAGVRPGHDGTCLDRQEHSHEQELPGHIVGNLIEPEETAFGTVPAATNPLDNRLRNGPAYSYCAVKIPVAPGVFNKMPYSVLREVSDVNN